MRLDLPAPWMWLLSWAFLLSPFQFSALWFGSAWWLSVPCEACKSEETYRSFRIINFIYGLWNKSHSGAIDPHSLFKSRIFTVDSTSFWQVIFIFLLLYYPNLNRCKDFVTCVCFYVVSKGVKNGIKRNEVKHPTLSQLSIFVIIQ